MKILLKELEPLIQGLKSLEKEKMSCALAYKIVRNIKAVEEEVIALQESVRQVGEKYAERDEAGKAIINEDNTYRIPEKAMSLVQKELEQINQIGIEINETKINFHELEEINITPQQLQQIMIIIKEDE